MSTPPIVTCVRWTLVGLSVLAGCATEPGLGALSAGQGDVTSAEASERRGQPNYGSADTRQRSTPVASTDAAGPLEDSAITPDIVPTPRDTVEPDEVERASEQADVTQDIDAPEAGDAQSRALDSLDSDSPLIDSAPLSDSVAPDLDTDAPTPGPQDTSDGPEPDEDTLGPISDSEAQSDSSESPDIAAPTAAYEGTCCGANGSPGCKNSACAEAVCEEDPFCCDSIWDTYCATCAGGQEGLFGFCSGLENLCGCNVEAAGPCCQAHTTPLCESLACTVSVCSEDAWCCDVQWDSHCAECAQGEESYEGVPCTGAQTLCGCPAPETPPTHFELAEAWAPVWYHDSDDSAYEADYMTAFDFDGDTISANNWENLYAPDADLRAVVYWSLIETPTHWYILYANFHPRDWTEDCDPFLPFQEPCHENDMEGAMVMVAKDGTDWGSFVLLVTEAHNYLHIFRNDPSIVAKGSAHLESEGVTFENGRHPELYVESKGHGVCALTYDGSSHCEHPLGSNPFPGGDGIVYRYKGTAEEPSSGNDWDVSYALVPLYDTIWQERTNICDGTCTFDGTFTYDGVSLPKAFDGDTWGDDKANPPWAWDDPGDGPVYRGDFFFRPAHAVTTWLSIPQTVSHTYLFNPFLDDL